MKHVALLSSLLAWCVLGPVAQVSAAPPAVAVPVGGLSSDGKTAAAITPAKACLSDISAFSNQMQKDGYWVGASVYGYGYPLDGYGYGYPMGRYPPAAGNGYYKARAGYEVRNLIASANILAQDGQQDTCEAVLATTRDVYKRYADDLRGKDVSLADGPDWWRQQIDTALPVTNWKTAVRSDQLIDTDVRNPQTQGLGSVHDIVMSPRTGKIAYLIIARGGIFGFDTKYVPVPWDNFKVTRNVNLLVLDVTDATMNAAPEVTDDQFAPGGHFDQESQKVDAYWKAHLVRGKSGE